jgi:hypothetical protein
MTRIDDRTVALFGGVSQRGANPVAFNDLFLLTVRRCQGLPLVC